jgi:hypothetical protein
VYRNAAIAIESGVTDGDFPSVQDGAHGVHFIHSAVASHKEGQWVAAAYSPPATS